MTLKLTIKFDSFGCSREHLDLQFSFVVSGTKMDSHKAGYFIDFAQDLPRFMVVSSLEI